LERTRHNGSSIGTNLGEPLKRNVGCFWFIEMTAVERAIEKWKLEELELHSPSEESIVVAKLGALGRAFSRDVLNLYVTTGGMQDGYSDSHMWSLWSLDRVISETSHYARPHILFADFLIDSHFYCFQYENEKRSAVAVDYFNGEEPELLAGSVEEFFEILNNDAVRLRMFE
jgi:hypothetical protein